ncbi:hypothetical protein [Vulcaniibacterium tengchongense]|uniref:Uncharacterized protein n=1 Tax=Vulcaniibacterium tengchongense TaxID=1273429 RepID=A0A3N4W8T4_9GAMM|nr:hypothetical protein [Vulcaniibacterium tengchongense]RPE81634.1 hypothetical protein EDC50_0826 [Vulcaniibacterium tengchongense]
MKTDKPIRPDRVEQTLRWATALALAAAVWWALSQGVDGSGPLAG